MISEELLRIQQAKNNIKSSVKAKGVEIPPTALISDYPGYIDQIPQGGPTPTPVSIDSFYVDGWWEHQEGNWALVKRRTTCLINYKLTSSSSTQTWSYTTGTLDEWVNLDDAPWRTAEYISLNTSGSLYAINADIPNYINGVGGSRSFVWCDTDIINVKVSIKALEGDLTQMYYSRSNLMTCEIHIYHPELMNVTNMYRLFYGCNSLQSLVLSGWNVENVANMSYMFASCSSLVSLDLSGWNTRSATTMYCMFSSCNSLQSLDLSGWNVENVDSMGTMFNQCFSLKSLDLSGWNVESVTAMSSMFENCVSLQSLDLSGWNPRSATTMANMFYACRSLKSLDLSGWYVENVTNMQNMFYECNALQSLDLSGWNPRSVTTTQMFYNCYALQSLDLSGWNLPYIMYVSGISLINLRVDALPMDETKTFGNVNRLNNESLQYLAEHLPTPRTYEKTVYNINDFDIDLNGQWVVSTYTNPDGDTYDMYMSDSNYHVSNGVAVMNITIRGNGHFEFFINSYGESGYDFTRVYNLDSTSSILLDTKSFPKDPSGPIDTNYKKVEFDIEDGGTHTIKIDYKKDGSGDSSYDRGFILVKKAELIPPVETITVVESPMKISVPSAYLNLTNNPWINILKEKKYIR